jgi:uncharacterized protein YecE (DUF72 family)
LPAVVGAPVAAGATMARAWIGISGWNYPRWRGAFYPDGLRQKDELAFAAAQFDSIEVNGTFYSLKRPADFAAWRAATPPGFLFAVKGSRFLTHMKRLHEPRTALANFFAQGVLALGAKLGPVLWQFPLQVRYDTATAARFDAFLAMLPRDTHAAAELASEHGPALAGRASFDPGPKHRVRHAVEVRHESFFVEPFVRLLRHHGVALVCSHAAEWRYVEEPTADFVYVRLHGGEHTYSSRYADAELDRLAAAIRCWNAGGQPADSPAVTALPPPPARRGRDVFVYFDNDAKVHAPRDARRLLERLAQSTSRAAQRTRGA